MKVFATYQRNEDFAVDLSLEGEMLHIRCRHALPRFKSDGESNMSDLVVEERGDWLIHDDVLHEEPINLGVLRNMPDFHDHAAFLYYMPVGLRKEYVNNGHMQPANLYALTQASKLSGPQHGNLISGLHPLLNALVPFQESPFSEWMLGVNVYDPALVAVTGDLEVVPCPGLDVARNLYLPEVRFEQGQVTAVPGGTVMIAFYLSDTDGNRITNRDAEVFLDTTAGSLNFYRIKTQGGEGRVIFRALDLKSGDVAKIKCGFKYFSGTDDSFVTVA